MHQRATQSRKSRAALTRYAVQGPGNTIEYGKFNKRQNPEVASQFRERARAYYHKKYRKDGVFTSAFALRALLRKTIIRIGGKKSDKSHDVLGYSPRLLKLRIECQFAPGMSWENYGEWHIDHRKPVSAFMAQGITNPKTINMLCNLRPLWAYENQKKGASCQCLPPTIIIRRKALSLDIALSYASRGWLVFPVRAKEEYDNITGEVFAPKTPLTSNGLRGASKNERIIREWWRRYPDAMVGIPTGSTIDAFILDLDIKPGVGDGHDWLVTMESEYGRLPITPRARTMGGGTHVFFKHVDGVRNRGKLGIATDIRGEGGYIVSPGSTAADGRSYRWDEGRSIDDVELAEAPQWLLDLVLPPPVTQARHDYTYTPGGNEPYIERAVQSELDMLARAPMGGRGSQVNASAFSLGQLVGAGALSRAEAEDGLWQAAVACGVVGKDGEREIRAKIRRGLDAGTRQPREIPEREQDNTRLVDISRMIANGLSRGKKNAANNNDTSWRADDGACDLVDAASTDYSSGGDDDGVLASAPLETDNQNDSGTTEHTLATQENSCVAQAPPVIALQQPATAQLPIVATRFSWIDPKTLKRREFAYGTHYIRKFVSVTSSPGGLGKTSNSIVEALAMRTGRPLVGVKPPQQLRPWLFNAEDPRDEMERRIMAACIHYRITPDELGDGLFVDTGREQELVVAREDKRTGVRIIEPIVEAVVSQIQQNRIDVMIIDPFVSTHAVNENDNGAIDKVAKLWAQVADYTNCAIDVVHHIKKVGDREATVEDSRGAVALLAAARSARVLNRMSEEQAADAGLTKEDRFDYFGISYGKANLTKLSGKTEWRKMVSVPLGNGGGLMKPQDHAGVVTEWHWPGSEEIAAELTEQQLAEIYRLLDNGQYKEGNRAKDWAGKAVAYALGVDVEEEAGRKKAGSVLKALLKEGKVVKSEEKDPVRRESAVFVRSMEFAHAN